MENKSAHLIKNAKTNIIKVIELTNTPIFVIANSSNYKEEDLIESIYKDARLEMQMLLEITNFFKLSYVENWFVDPEDIQIIINDMVMTSISNLDEKNQFRLMQAVKEYDELPPTSRTQKKMFEIFSRWLPINKKL
ncbi:MAG: hypothetical protein RIB01_15465 [Balneola sp.]